MKLSSAALVLLLSATASTSSAFTPAVPSFAVRRRHSVVTSSLKSTTVKKDEVAYQAITSSEISEILATTKDFRSGDYLNSRELAEVAAVEARASVVSYLSQFQGKSGAAIVYSKLQENGVTVVNGFSGGAVLPLLDQFHEDNPRHRGSDKPLIRWITNSNESSAGHIAEGYAKSSPLNGAQKPVGVVVATSGPGVTNLITPFQDAICDGVPLVVLCGQAATVAPSDAFQQAPAVALTTPCTKWSYQIRSAAEVPFVMDYAFYVARNGRPGPVFIDLPKDLQNQVVTDDLIASFVESNLMSSSASNSPFARLVQRRRSNGELFQALHLGPAQKGLAFEVAKASESYNLQPVKASSTSDKYNADHHPTNRIIHTESIINGQERRVTKEGDLKSDSAMFKELANLVRSAKKPVIIAGQGCNDCPEDLKILAEKLQIPVTTTLHALGCFDERHNLALNMLGMHGHPTPNFLVQESDLIVCIGSRFDDRITGRVSEFVPEARKAAMAGRGGIVHVDIRLSEMAKQVEPTYFVHSTGKDFIRMLNQAFQDEEITPQTGPWISRMKELQRDFPVKIPTFPSVKVARKHAETGEESWELRTPMSAQHVMTVLNDQLLAANKMDDAIFTTGVGVHQMVAAQLLTWTQPRQMLSSGSLGTMGVSLGYSIGAKLANGRKIVISIDGDGSFNMTFTELKTVAEHQIPIKIIIFDNESQMMVEYWQKLFHEERLLAVRNEKNPDYCKLADAFGIKNLFCNSEEELPAKMQEFLFSDPDEPVLFHVKIERTPCLPLVAPGQRLDNMILEDVEVDVRGAAAPS